MEAAALSQEDKSAFRVSLREALGARAVHDLTGAGASVNNMHRIINRESSARMRCVMIMIIIIEYETLICHTVPAACTCRALTLYLTVLLSMPARRGSEKRRGNSR